MEVVDSRCLANLLPPSVGVTLAARSSFCVCVLQQVIASSLFEEDKRRKKRRWR